VLVRYRGWDQKPRSGPPDGPMETLALIAADALQTAMSEQGSPGEMELLDALNLMERGDYSGAVRRVTTALEVIIEFALRTELLTRHPESAVEEQLRSSRNDFPGRVRQYEKLSGRRLRPEQRADLERTRALRHEIVHQGTRVRFSDRGRAQTAVDTGRWLFNWFENRPDRVTVREKRLALRSLGRHFSMFDAYIEPDGVVVRSPRAGEDR
jgi:hypothetical protein